MSNRVKKICWSICILAIIGILGLTGYYISTNEPVPISSPVATNTEPTDEEIAETIEALITESEEQEALKSTGEATATLESVRDNGNEFAVAIRKFNAIKNEIEFEMVATLGDPQTGNSYIVYLTDGPTSLRVGDLNKEVENTYALSATFSRDISSLKDVVVIESGNTEQDVLKGFFE
jgi:hypothetical protein